MTPDALKKLVRIFMACMILFMMSVRICPTEVAASDIIPTITVQPQDTEVSYPDGAQFHIEVDYPEGVVSYQWEMTEGVNQFILAGESARTDTLTVPSTEQDLPDMYYRCIITDTLGNEHASEYGKLHINNGEEDKTVLYIGEYGLNPGDSLDLAATPYGSGTVKFDEDGVNVTFDSFRFDNTHIVYDYNVSPSLGIYLMRRHTPVQEYYLHFENECSVRNIFYDEDYHSGGIDFNGYFASGDDPNAPTIVLCGDGSLTLEGGSNMIYTDSNVEVDMTLKGKAAGDIFCDGITCQNLIVGENAVIDLQTNGTGVFARGDMRTMDGSSVSFTSTARPVSVGATAKNIIYLVGSLFAKNSEINVKGLAIPEYLVPDGKYIGVFCGILLNESGKVDADGTKITVDMSAGKSDQPFALNLQGITGGDEGASLILSNGSEVNITIDAPGVEGTAGIAMPGIVSLEKDCTLNIDVLGTGEATALECGRTFEVTDANVTSSVRSDTDGHTYGIVTGGVNISLSDAKYSVKSSAANGIALAADTGERDEESVPYEKDYTPQFITLSGSAAVTAPEKSDISLFSVSGYGSLIRAETVFDLADTSNPAAEVMIGVPSAPAAGGTGFVVPLIVGAIAILAMIFIRKR